MCKSHVAANKLGGVNWLNSEKQVKQWPAQRQWHSDHWWQQWGWRVGRDGCQWKRCSSSIVFCQLWNEHNL